MVLWILLTIFTSACSGNNNNNSEIKTLDKAPDSLGEINKAINEVIENTGKVERIRLNIDFEDEEEEETQPHAESTEKSNKGEEDSESNSQIDENSDHGGSESHGIEMGATEEDKEEKNSQTWNEIEKSLEELYQNMTSYEDDAIKKGISQDRVVQSKDAINKLVKAVEERNVINIYDFGSQSLLYLKPFYDLYKDDYRGEICELKYHIYQYYLKAVTGDKEGARDQLSSKDENINRMRILIGEDNKKIRELDKVSTSLDSIGISIDEDSKRVLILEKDTIIKKLESLE